ncbi:hypothetical protein HPB48_018279 [Haemaphysalis longicornis]|uniref:Uncharacterized protein n=1 Tax=Haemaphysalis longicornis TaxID=44386 RepID=A0A9J6GGP3_HAELO|nr:hypothetical protein HPB48_018279 [Haemaphysalis longicornis]
MSRLRDLKKQEVKICEEQILLKLAASVKKITALSLEMFFNAKPHKEGFDFRVIVSKKDSWQHQVGLVLQQSLFLLPVNDPYQVRGPHDVYEFILKVCPPDVSVFWIDLKDMHYSLWPPVCRSNCGVPEHSAYGQRAQWCLARFARVFLQVHPRI